MNEITLEVNGKKVTKTVPDNTLLSTFLREHLNILLTKKGKREGQLIGTTGWMQSVHIMGSDNLIGELALVEIINSGPRSLEGKLRNLH